MQHAKEHDGGNILLVHSCNDCNKQNNSLHGDARRRDNGRRGILTIAPRSSPIAGTATATGTGVVAAVSTLSTIACRTIGARGAAWRRQIGKTNATTSSLIIAEVENRVHSSQERSTNNPLLQKEQRVMMLESSTTYHHLIDLLFTATCIVYLNGNHSSSREHS